MTSPSWLVREPGGVSVKEKKRFTSILPNQHSAKQVFDTHYMQAERRAPSVSHDVRDGEYPTSSITALITSTRQQEDSITKSLSNRLGRQIACLERAAN